MNEPESLRFLTKEGAHAIRDQYGTPTYCYSLSHLHSQALKALDFPNAFGLTVRYAMKANPNRAILKLFHSLGIHIDASSGNECWRAMEAGITPNHISLSSQEIPSDFKALRETGIKFNACSLHQLELYGKLFPASSLGIRVNPGQGTGGGWRTNVGGQDSSFGIWWQHLAEVKRVCEKYNLTIIRIHTHVGSGCDPLIWKAITELSLDVVASFPQVTTLNLGGGFKVGRMKADKSVDLQLVGAQVKDAFIRFADKYKVESEGSIAPRQLHLEIEPGTFLVANAGSLVCTIQDIVSTTPVLPGSQLQAPNDPKGYEFLKLDAGMTECIRPTLYGAQHPIVVVPNSPSSSALKPQKYVVVGHCCETGDVISTAPPDAGFSVNLYPRSLSPATIGDLCIIEGVGAYSSSMSVTNYNSFLQAAEVLVEDLGGECRSTRLIRRRQVLQELWRYEVDAPSIMARSKL